MNFASVYKVYNMELSTITRKMSCNFGWLRTLVHIIFGILIASSFILILLMTVRNSRQPDEPPHRPSRCTINNCDVSCYEAPYFEYYKEYIQIAITEATSRCSTITLKLNKPSFINSTMPENWLDNIYIKGSIRRLYIIGGNLKYISANSFMSKFSNGLKIIHFEDVKISIWKEDTLTGLFNLNTLIIKNCELTDVQKNALRAVESTLQVINIQVPHSWDPINVTGSSNSLEVVTVRLSHNSFFNHLNNNTFRKIPSCKVLHLDFCKVNFIGTGTFDHFQKLQNLYLNNNYLVTLPIGIFDQIILQPIRIALHSNIWLCDCSRNDFRLLSINNILITDLICQYPDEVHGVLFTDFYNNYCGDKNPMHITTNYIERNISLSCYTPKIAYISASCENINSSLNENMLIPMEQTDDFCVANRIRVNVFTEMTNAYSSDFQIQNSDWITPVFLSGDDKQNVVEVLLSLNHDIGLLWYQSSCKTEIYCVATVPNILKLYNINIYANYTFCPYDMISGKVLNMECVTYNLTYESIHTKLNDFRRFILYGCLSLICLAGGAICVYVIIQRYPTLLNGNKRVLLVKHKNIEALILPPEIKLRSNTFNNSDLHDYKSNIFVVSQSKSSLFPQSVIRSHSIRSNVSNDASYISALQPTEEQLVEWRFHQRGYDNETKITDFSNLPFFQEYEYDSLSNDSFVSVCSNYETPK